MLAALGSLKHEQMLNLRLYREAVPLWLDCAMTTPRKPPNKAIRLRPAGFEYCVRRGTAVLEMGFNTEGQAQIWAEHTGLIEGSYSIERRPVGTWETVVAASGTVPRHVEMDIAP